MKNTVLTLQKQKEEGNKITMLTAYDYSVAGLIDAAGIETILVGDSLGMTMLGYDDTLPVTMDDMVHHTRAVAKGAPNAFVVADMPFMSYHTGTRDAVINAGRLIKEGGANAVKLEGGVDFADEIRAIVKASIPVCAHIGMTPQSVNTMGGFKVQGKNVDAAQKVVDDAKAVQEAGAFMVVLECVPAKLAELITATLHIPTIGIGAGAGCDGQVLVYQDMLNMFQGHQAKFVKHFGEIGQAMQDAFKAYSEEVKSGVFPAPEHTYKIDDEVLSQIKA
ncbi:MAG: 3-methyl-2-oxobutanoate hydroxymethyltransferase [Eubacterium sp.]|nr:3-methyl-2-oxobutanoate hydroxymethyltransferase [Eubacterium sp.]